MMFGLEVAFLLSEQLLRLIKRIRITYRNGGFQIELAEKKEEKSIDERIGKIDEARSSLVEALDAIDELHSEAERNKVELKNALQNLAETERNKGKLENELENIRQVMQTDIATFRNIAGIPSQVQIKKERYIGFVTGVIASIVASALIWSTVTLAQITVTKYKESKSVQETSNANATDANRVSEQGATKQSGLKK